MFDSFDVEILFLSDNKYVYVCIYMNPNMFLMPLEQSSNYREMTDI